MADLYAPIKDLQRSLFLERQLLVAHLHRKRFLIHMFKKAGTQAIAYCKRSANDTL